MKQQRQKAVHERDKPCLWCFFKKKKQDLNQSPQLQRLARNWIFACSKSRYDTFQKANNEGADQSAQMRRLVFAFIVRQPQKTSFLASRPILSKCMLYFGTYYISECWPKCLFTQEMPKQIQLFCLCNYTLFKINNLFV